MARFCAEKWRSVGGFARYILKNRRRFSAQNVAVFCVAAATRQRSTRTRLLSRVWLSLQQAASSRRKNAPCIGVG